MAKIDHVHLDVSKFILANAIVFWDFDGVIKDSVAIKNNAFVTLFDDHGSGLAKRITLHHEANGGMSRFQKIPIYLSWAGLPNDKDSVHQYCYMFSNLVTEAVCDAPWVPGVKEFLLKYNYVRHFVLVSATPQSELELILDKIGIAHCFRWVVGA
ncbi:MAG: hypothetical protein P8N92_02415, partial [Burkholderiales bacterium]|nr:hypothetical protein [Burkholderiales bacterium]